MHNLVNETINTFSSLPSRGEEPYAVILAHFLKFLATEGVLELTEAKKWFVNRYEVQPSTAAETLRTVTRLGLIEKPVNRAIKLSSFGREWLQQPQDIQTDILREVVMKYGVAMAQILGVIAKASDPLSLRGVFTSLSRQFENWETVEPYKVRLLWLVSLGLIDRAPSTGYLISEIGREYASRFPASYDPRQQFDTYQNPITDPQLRDYVNQLVENITAAAFESSKPSHLEQLLAQSFEFLGFDVRLLGGIGETDILATAVIGSEKYSVIIDAKARSKGRLETLESYKLQQHREKLGADYIVVAAWTFAGMRIVQEARDAGVLLLPIPLLNTWLRAHAEAPLNPLYYREVLSVQGLLNELPQTVQNAYVQFQQQIQLIVDIVDLIDETYRLGVEEPLSATQLFSMLVTRQRQIKYGREDIQTALKLFRHPVIRAAFGDEETGTTLAVNRQALARIFRVLAMRIEQTQAQI